MRTVIAGSRGVTDPAVVEQAMRECGWWPTVVLSGTARGVDRLGEQWAGLYGIPVELYPADWAADPRGAGHARNAVMAQQCDALVAVWDGRSPGTRHMIETARSLGRRVHVLEVAPPAAPFPPPPPPVTDLPAGTQLVAGLGVATVLPELDFETYSEAGFVWDEAAGKWRALPNASQGKKGLFVVGAALYTAHPTCEVLCLAYDLKDGLGRRFWRPGLPPPFDLWAHVMSGLPIEAHNVAFERWVWEHVCVPRMGWPVVQPHQWRCSMAKSRAHTLPGGLDAIGQVLDLPVVKDAEGKRLLDKFSVPRNPTKTDPRRRVLPLWTLQQVEQQLEVYRADLGHSITPAKAGRMVEAWRKVLMADHMDTLALGRYNTTDIEAEAHVSAVVPDMTPLEVTYWQDDQTINHRGVAIDVPALQACIAIIEQAHAQYNAELHALTGGLVAKASELATLSAWLRTQGVPVGTGKGSMDEDALDALLSMPTVQGPGRRALEIRAAVGSASVKKVFAMRNMLSAANRLHDLYVWHGARTGRPTGSGPQPTNLPKAGPPTSKCGACGHAHRVGAEVCPWCGVPVPPGRKVDEWNPAAAEDALQVIASKSLPVVEHYFGDAMAAVAGVLRGLFVAAPGHDFISSDFTAIEGVVVAALAGEQWRIDAYAADAPMYLLSAERMFGVSVDEMKAYAKANGQHHPLRQKGKGGELACLAAGTEVLTRRGYVQIQRVEATDELWDGTEWVTHSGVIAKGQRETLALDGIEMTPEHLCLCSGSWLEARRLATSESTLCQSLATGSENLPLQARSLGRETPRSGSSAVAADRNTSSRSQVCGRAPARAASLAASRLRQSLGAHGSATTSWSPTARTATACSTGCPLPSAAATTRGTRSLRTTEVAASPCTGSGAMTADCSCSTSSLLTGGTTRALRWIGRTWTAATSRATSVLSRGPTTKGIGGRSPLCSAASPSLRPVFDILNAGPRSRFTVRTNSGHLIVHNCGFGGWVSSMRAFGVDGTDEELKDTVLKWRAASPSLVWFWGGQTKGKQPGAADQWDRTWSPFGLEGMAILAVQNPGTEYPVLRRDGTPTGISYVMRGDVLFCRLLSGRAIPYHRPRLQQAAEDWRGLSLSFETSNTNPKNGPIGWIRMNTYGGRLCENCVQATARDIQMNAIRQLEAAGYPIVLHTYDEVVAEVPEGWGSVEELERIMCAVPPWAAGWPIKAAGGWRAGRYRKG